MCPLIACSAQDRPFPPSCPWCTSALGSLFWKTHVWVTLLSGRLHYFPCPGCHWLYCGAVPGGSRRLCVMCALVGAQRNRRRLCSEACTLSIASCLQSEERRDGAPWLQKILSGPHWSGESPVKQHG